MRSDDVSLGEMIAAADQLLALLTNPQAERLLRQDRAFRHSVFFEFVIIGEGVAQLSEELKLRRPGIPWRQISAFRHRIAHGYLELSLGIVWKLWQNEIPRLRLQLAEVLAAEFPAGQQG